MNIERRKFLGKAAVLGIGLFAAEISCSEEKGIPSEPGTPRKETTGPKVIELPAFEKNSAFPLDQALVNRKSTRSFTDTPLSPENLSRLLWAMTGVNRPDGRRTTPSALAAYPVDVFSALPGGVYRYETKEHRLVRVLSEDIRSKVPIQPSFKGVAMIALYVANVKKRLGGKRTIRWADIEIGCMVQNLYLEAASLGMGSCVFGLVRYGKVSELLGLEDNQLLRIAQVVGPVEK